MNMPKMLLMLGLLAIFSAAVQGETKTFLMTYRIDQINGSANYPREVSSYAMFAGNIYTLDTLQKVGFSDGVAHVVKVRPTYVIFQAEITYDFTPGGVTEGVGKITTSGDTDTSLEGGNYMAITGGTLRFNGATGQILAVEQKPPYRLKDSVFELKVTFFLDKSKSTSLKFGF